MTTLCTYMPIVLRNWPNQQRQRRKGFPKLCFSVHIQCHSNVLIRLNHCLYEMLFIIYIGQGVFSLSFVGYNRPTFLCLRVLYHLLGTRSRSSIPSQG